jgi:hypothetical protein
LRSDNNNRLAHLLPVLAAQPRFAKEATMDPQVFEELMMTVLVGGLVLFMAFIVWDLAKKSKAGRFGTMILFLALGLGVLGFVIKTVVIAGMEGV